MKSTVEVHIIVTDVNDSSSDVKVTHPVHAGDLIPATINAAAAEAAAWADYALKFRDNKPIHRDWTKRARP
jgi:hypothetical protein